MSQPVHSRLHPLLRAYPGAVLEIALDGSLGASNGRLEARLGRGGDGPVTRLLEPTSAARLLRLIERGPRPEPASATSLWRMPDPADRTCARPASTTWLVPVESVCTRAPSSIQVTISSSECGWSG